METELVYYVLKMRRKEAAKALIQVRSADFSLLENFQAGARNRVPPSLQRHSSKRKIKAILAELPFGTIEKVIL